MSLVRPAASTGRASVWTASACVRQKGGAHRPKPHRPRQRWQQASSRTDNTGLPLAVVLTAANPHDSTLFVALLDDLPAIMTPSAQRRSTPGKVHADKAYHDRHCRAELRQRGIKVRIARRGSSPRSGRGGIAGGWNARSPGCLALRRLRVRFEVCDERFSAFVLLASSLVCFRALTTHYGARRKVC